MKKTPTRLSRHIQRTNSLFPEMATRLDKRLVLQQDILDYPAKDAGSIGHIARLLAQFGLPHLNPGDDTKTYTRSNGELTFQIQANAYDGGGIPWGVLPRLLLAYVSSQAVLTRSPTIQLGTNVSTFLRDELAMEITGGKNGSITRIKEQAFRLFTSYITIVRKTHAAHDETGKTGTAMGMVKIANAIWDPPIEKDPDQIWHSKIDLDYSFYQSILSAAVPIDWRILRGIRQSPLAIDLYFWLTYRMKTIQFKQPIPFFGPNSLHEQLGAGYDEIDKGCRYEFKKQVFRQLDNIRFFWPDLRTFPSEDGACLILFPSPTSVSSLR